MTDETFTPGEEIDLTGDGVPNKEFLFTITEAKEESTENGVRAVIRFENTDEPLVLTQRYWLRHSNEQAQKIGRGQLRTVAIAATKSPKFSLAGLEGRQVYATPKEKDGFVNLTRFKNVEAEAVAA